MNQEIQLPPGVKGYGKWVDGLRVLPRGHQMPVEVEYCSGRTEIRITVSGDWREVVSWRPVELTQGMVRRLRKEKKLIAMEEELK